MDDIYKNPNPGAKKPAAKKEPVAAPSLYGNLEDIMKEQLKKK